MKTAEEILNEQCDSLPAWTHNRKQAVIAAMKEYASQEKIAYNNELLEDLLEAFQQACWIEPVGYYDHLEISTWKRIQRTLIEAGKIKAEECYRQV